jgi:hypothetical protein
MYWLMIHVGIRLIAPDKESYKKYLCGCGKQSVQNRLRQSFCKSREMLEQLPHDPHNNQKVKA